MPLLTWPENSPDLNPIENVWSKFKRLVSRKNNTNRHILIENIKKVWHEAPEITECIRVCIESIPKRLKVVISAKGGHTKY